MTTLPGNLTSPTAGPLLQRGAPVTMEWHQDDDPPRMVTGVVLHDIDAGRVLWWSDDPYIDRDNRACVFLALDLTDPAGMDLAARWLARHHGLTVGATAPTWAQAGWHIWDLRDFPSGMHVGFHFDADTARKFSDPKRGMVYHLSSLCGVTDPAEALALACLAAAGVTNA